MISPGLNRRRGVTLIELLAAIAVLSILVTVGVNAAWRAIYASSLATSASNMRHLSAGAAAYLIENQYVFWRYRENIREPDRRGVRWWFGFEDLASMQRPEGERFFDPQGGPLGGFIPQGIRPDPSFELAGKVFKPKYAIGYIGVGYNVLLGGGWMGFGEPVNFHHLEEPARVVVFATSGQVNTFQAPASAANPMIEEFYGIDDVNTTVHFRHNGKALVAFTDSSIGYLPMDPATLDPRAPAASVGRFAPQGDARYLR